MGSIQYEEPTPGERSLNATLDHVVRTTPDRIFGWIPKSDLLDDGFDVLTFQDFYRCVCAAAHWLDDQLGVLAQRPNARETLAYIGPDDLRYAALILAADRTNRSLLVPLMYNSLEAQTRLIDSTRTVALLAPNTHGHAWNNVIAERSHLKVTNVPDLDFFLRRPSPVYPYEQRMTEFWDSAPFIIQTSGTTGTPKPLYWSNAACSTVDINSIAVRLNRPLSEQSGAVSGYKDALIIVTMPQSWIIGLFLTLLGPLFSDCMPLLPPPSVPMPPSFEDLQKIHQLVPSTDSTLLTPDVIRRIYTSPGGPEFLGSFRQIWFAGAPLPPAIGDPLGKLTRIQSMLGSTDVSGYPYLANDDPADWQWLNIQVDDEWFLDHFAEDLYELKVRKNPSRLRPVFYLHPEMEVFGTSDLFRQHPDPTKKHLWQPSGRADDFVKLSNMTKFNAIEIEFKLNSDPAIERSVVGGDDKNNTFVLLRLTNDKYASDAEALDAVWPTIEAVNETMHSDAYLRKDRIILVKPDRPLGVTSKGTTERRKALQAYAPEIEALYQTAI